MDENPSLGAEGTDENDGVTDCDLVGWVHGLLIYLWYVWGHLIYKPMCVIWLTSPSMVVFQ